MIAALAVVLAFTAATAISFLIVAVVKAESIARHAERNARRVEALHAAVPQQEGRTQ